MPGAELPRAAVFFARDFPSIEFPRMRPAFADVARVYLVISEREAANVRANDADGDVIVIERDGPSGATLIDDAEAISRDRFLRLMDNEDVDATRRAIAAAADKVLTRYRPIYYVDEPVSGYANEIFNKRFTAAGALCLHFQISWLPGYCFFVRDKAQNEPVQLDMLPDSTELVRKHIELRAAGLAKPAYVLPYDRLLPRVRDLVLTLGKAVYRTVFRRSAAYIDRDPSPHIFHARCLARSIFGRYSPDPARSREDVRYVIFPLHYEPEALLKYFSRFYRQEEMASEILDSLPSGYKLILKEHPSQPGALLLPKWADLRASKRVVILRGDYRVAPLMKDDPVVVSLGSTFSLEAALAGCAVGVFGDVHFKGAPGVVRIDSPGDWRNILDQPRGSPEAITAWYADFLTRHCFEGNFLKGGTWFGDLPGLGAALRKHVPE